MSDIVIILGAGASRECGSPLMHDFLDVASDLLLSRTLKERTEVFERVFTTISSLQSVHSKAQLDLNNIESVFAALEYGRIIQKVPGLATAEIEASLSALKELICKTLELTIQFPCDAYGNIGVPVPYESFVETLTYLQSQTSTRPTISIITFNYDIAIDMALFRAGLGPDYIIGKTRHTKEPIQLMKLHGSLNWAHDTGTQNIRILHLSDYLSKYKVRHPDNPIYVPIGSQLTEFFSKDNIAEVDRDPVIVPPSWHKADYHRELSEIWTAAALHLSGAKYIYVIGYSLPETDLFFKHLYALGTAGGKPFRRIVVYNPDNAGPINEKYRRLLGPGALSRYEFKPITFSDAVHDIRGHFSSNR